MKSSCAMPRAAEIRRIVKKIGLKIAPSIFFRPHPLSRLGYPLRIILGQSDEGLVFHYYCTG
jgi:hypothetical protein